MKKLLLIFCLFATQLAFAQSAMSEFEAYKKQQNAEFQKFLSGGSYFSVPIDTKPIDVPPPPPSVTPSNVHDYTSFKAAFDGHVGALENEFAIICDKGFDPTSYLEKVTDLNAGFYNAYYIQLKRVANVYTASYRLSYNDDYKVLKAWREPKFMARLTADEQTLYKEALRLLPTLINKDMSERDKALAIHDYLVRSVTYDVRVLKDIQANPNAFKAYGALLDKIAVCDGYSKSMRLLGTMAGLKITKINGSSNSVPHSWNRINIGGNWSNIDTTFDDPVGAAAGYVSHDYFMISDKQLRIDHQW